MVARRTILRGGSVAIAALVAVGALGAATTASNSAAGPKPSSTTTYTYDVNRPTALFIGDSYTQGTGANSASSKFATIVSESRRWVEQNWARGGTGYLAEPKDPKSACGRRTCPNYRTMLALISVRDPKYVIVSGGRNDTAIDLALVDPAIKAFFRSLRTQYPKSRIVVISPLWDSRQPPGALASVAQVVRSNAALVHATYLDIGEPLRGHRSWLIADGIHPNDRGHAAIAERVIAAMERNGVGPR
jgi:lysophospholipase L1-like esterase